MSRPLNLAPKPTASTAPQYFWLWIVCLLGLDYFSTLAYQPSVTHLVAGRLGPLATALVVLVTLCGVVPVYCYLAGRSPSGYGSIGMLERLVRGWRQNAGALDAGVRGHQLRHAQDPFAGRRRRARAHPSAAAGQEHPSVRSGLAEPIGPGHFCQPVRPSILPSR